jgi:hypothetical protein
MSATSEMRKSVRVKIKNGDLRIHHPVMPPLICRLVDLSEGGARCLMRTHGLDQFAATAWKQLLGSGKHLQVELLAPGMDPCQIVSDVRHLKLHNESEIEFGFRFHHPDDAQREMIQRSIHLFTENVERDGPEVKEAHRTTVFIPSKKATTSTVRVAPVSEPPPRPAARRRTIVDMARGLIRGLTDSKAPVDYRGMKIGEILMRTGRLTPRQAVEAYEKSRSSGQKFGRYLIANGLVSPSELCRALSLQSGLPIVDLATVTMPETVFGLFDYETLTKNQIVPFNQFGSTVYVATTQPLSKTVVKELELKCKSSIKVFLAQDDVIFAALSSPVFAPEQTEGT